MQVFSRSQISEVLRSHKNNWKKAMMYYYIPQQYREHSIRLIGLCMLVSEAVVHESIPSTNIPLPGRPPGLCTYTRPRYQDFYHLNCIMVARGSGLSYDILSSNLLVDAALRCYFSFKLIYQLSQFSSEKPVL